MPASAQRFLAGPGTILLYCLVLVFVVPQPAGPGTVGDMKAPPVLWQGTSELPCSPRNRLPAPGGGASPSRFRAPRAGGGRPSRQGHIAGGGGPGSHPRHVRLEGTLPGGLQRLLLSAVTARRTCVLCCTKGPWGQPSSPAASESRGHPHLEPSGHQAARPLPPPPLLHPQSGAPGPAFRGAQGHPVLILPQTSGAQGPSTWL